ncbi:DNA packaging tegument protein [Murid herpesvirus 3]|uniref:DNA packaging tegument protein n=2 Tax=Murid betaherpesvirus 3 TaxID=2560603 RepID=A0A1P8VIV1_9BETA|nr:DNA packaging tegument protein [Murine roseolovirus]APZ76279.1 DNA packaging tegument protein [Murid betaherpesvirus 3]AYH64727.1 DNA packaging tegument protein [Murid herpesvirus 3]
MPRFAPYFQNAIVPIFESHRKNTLVFTSEEVNKLKDVNILNLKTELLTTQKKCMAQKLLLDELYELYDKLKKDFKSVENDFINVEREILEQVEIAQPQKNLIPKSPPLENIEELENAIQVGITQIDPYIHFKENFRNEIIYTFFNNAHMWNYSMGLWYHKLKRLLYNETRPRRVLKIYNVESIGISQELLFMIIDMLEKVTVYPMQDITVSDFEAAMCLLAAFYSVCPNTKIREDSTIIDILKFLPDIFKHLTNEINLEKSNSPNIRYEFRDPLDTKYFAPTYKNKFYHKRTFDHHILVRILLRKQIIHKIPGYDDSDVISKVNLKLEGTIKDDVLLLWTRKILYPKLGNNIPVFVYEQHYLRSGLVAVETLYLLWKILNVESIFLKRTGKFFLSVIFPNINNDFIGEDDFLSSSVKNFEYLVEKYIIPLYIHDQSITISMLFPGLVCLLIIESIKTGWEHGKKMQKNSNMVYSQTNQNIFLDFIITQLSNSNSLERLEKHDTLFFHFENGLDVALAFMLPKQKLISSASSLFNVGDLYDLLYFLVLGFLPVATIL